MDRSFTPRRFRPLRRKASASRTGGTRARDLLSFPPRDEIYEGSWLIRSCRPLPAARLARIRAPPGCPCSREDTVLTRRTAIPRAATVAPVCSSSGGSPDPVLSGRLGTRESCPAGAIPAACGGRPIATDGDVRVDKRMTKRAWRPTAPPRRARPPRRASVAYGDDLAREIALAAAPAEVPIVVIDRRRARRPSGRVRLALLDARDVALDAGPAEALRQIARTHARVLRPTTERSLRRRTGHGPCSRTRSSRGSRRERGRPVRAGVPLSARARWSIVGGRLTSCSKGRRLTGDFKTDRDPSDLKDQYERQLTLYCRAFAALRGRRVSGVLVRV